MASRRLKFLTALLVLLMSGLGTVSSTWAQADTLTPAIVQETLGPGQSTTVQKKLHLDALPAAADIIVAIDTTGSMGGAIAQAQAQAIQLCNDVKAAIPGARFAVVDFKDYPIGPYGGPGDFPYLLKTPGYVADCATFSAAIATMVASGGGDGPEANNRVHFEAYSDPVLTASHLPDAVEFLVVLADNVPHSIPSYGPCPSTSPFSDPGRNNVNESGGGDDLDTPETINGLIANDVTLLYIDYGGFALSCYQAMASATGGTAVSAGSDLSGTIIRQIRESSAVVDEVHLEVIGPCLLSITFSPASYTNVSTPADLTFTETITVPAGTAPGEYKCTVRAVADGAQRGNPEVINVVVARTTGKVTGGGQIAGADPLFDALGLLISPPAIIVSSNGSAEANFGFVIQSSGAGAPKGNLVYHDKGNDVRIKATSYTTLFITPGPCGPDTHATFTGTSEVNGSSADLEVEVDDCGEPSSGPPPDTFRIKAGTYTNGGPLIGGNIQIHK